VAARGTQQSEREAGGGARAGLAASPVSLENTPPAWASVPRISGMPRSTTWASTRENASSLGTSGYFFWAAPGVRGEGGGGWGKRDGTCSSPAREQAPRKPGGAAWPGPPTNLVKRDEVLVEVQAARALGLGAHEDEVHVGLGAAAATASSSTQQADARGKKDERIATPTYATRGHPGAVLQRAQ
jgi:hypothetical protein